MRHFVNIISSLKCKERVGTEKPLQSVYHFLENAVTTISHLDGHAVCQTKDLKRKEKTNNKHLQCETDSKLKPTKRIKTSITTMENNQKV